MTPTEYAGDELALWERAQSELREAERQRNEALGRGDQARFYSLRSRVATLRAGASALLARAVEKKLRFRRASGLPPDSRGGLR